MTRCGRPRKTAEQNNCFIQRKFEKYPLETPKTVAMALSKYTNINIIRDV